jgi:hypothetical protein
MHDKPRLLVMREQWRSDPLLDGILSARSETERETAVAEVLAEHAYGRIEKILAARFARARLQTDHIADLRHEVILRLVSRFRRLQSDDVIESFPDYVATVTFNIFEDFVRKSYPLRSQLKNRTLHALTHDPELAVWTHGGVRVCGLDRWKGNPPKEESKAQSEQDLGTLDAVRKDLRSVLRGWFEKVGAPQLLEVVVTALCQAAGIPTTESPQPLDDASDKTSPAADPTVELTNLQNLRTLWKEIRDLPTQQRIALLLQARDSAGESVIHMLPNSRIATVREIAETLQMGDQELAAVWPRLPIDDLRIATRLGVTRQQVINLRRSARSRLLRRMRRGDVRRMQ